MYYSYTYIKQLCHQVFIYNEEPPCTSHTSRAKWPSYFGKIWALYVSQIYMVYISHFLFSFRNAINLSHHERVYSGAMMGEVSLKTVSLNIFVYDGQICLYNII